jgi:hypothetical protein
MVRRWQSVVALAFVVGLLAAGHSAEAVPAAKPWGTHQVLLPPDSSKIISVATDGVTAVVGEDKWPTGEAHVYTWNGSAWVWQQALSSPLPPPAPDRRDGFGHRVEVHGNVILVGQHGGGISSAHVFEYAGGTWSHSASISEASGEAIALWGTAIAATTDSGTVATYDLVGGSLVSTGTLSPVTPYAECEFGSSIDVHDDVLVVGDYFSHDPCDPAVHVFRRSGASWALEQELGQPSGNGYLDGWIAVWGDTIAVGDPDITGTDTPHVAKVHVYHWTGSTWTRVQILKRPTQNFGDAVALHDTTLVVGDATTGGTWVYTRSTIPASPLRTVTGGTPGTYVTGRGPDAISRCGGPTSSRRIAGLTRITCGPVGISSRPRSARPATTPSPAPPATT